MFKRLTSVMAIAAGVCLSMSAPLMGQSKEQGTLLYNEALQLQQKALSRQDLEKAVKKYEQALRIFETLGDRKRAADTAMELGNVYGRLKQWDKALAQCGKLADIAKELRDPDIEAAAHFGQGQVRALRASATSQPGGGHFAEMPIPGLEKLGKQKVWISDVDNEAILALDHLEKALEIYRSRGNLKWEGETLRLISLTYKKLGREVKASEYSKKAQAIEQKLDSKRPETDGVNQSRGKERFLGIRDREAPASP